MAIFAPDGTYSRNDIRLIELLERHLSEIPDGTLPTNRPQATHLSEREIDALIGLLEQKLEDREFRLASALIDAVSSRTYGDIRELYLSGRTRRDRTRALASKQYADFLARLGLPSAPANWYPSADRMSFEHFLRMERRAFAELGISPRVTELALRFVALQTKDVEGVRDGDVRLSSNFLVAAIEMTKSGLAALKRLPDNLADGQQLAGALTVIVNVGLLYTTRDWSVTGTLSTIAGGLGAMAPNRRK